MTIVNMFGRAVKTVCQGGLSWVVFSLFYLFTLSLLVSSCSMIDEDQSDCDYTKIEYDLTLVTNVRTEIETQLETQLNTQLEMELGVLLKDFLGNIFTDYAHDVNLSFYDTHGDSLRLQHDEHIMDANQASYTLNLPMREYMHLAAANLVDNYLVDLVNDERCHHSVLFQDQPDTIPSHTTGLFTARQKMEVLEGIDQNFSVHLYMANCAAALVIDTRGHDVSGIQVYTTGFATRFLISDSTYVYPRRSPIVRTTKIAKSEDSQEVAFCSVNFPSRESKISNDTRSVIETEEPFISQPGEEALWEFQVYVTQPDGSITKTVLSVKTPLRAGQFKIIKCWIGDQGEINVPSETPDPGPGPDPGTTSSEVSTSVTFDWKPGLVIGN